MGFVRNGMARFASCNEVQATIFGSLGLVRFFRQDFSMIRPGRE